MSLALNDLPTTHEPTTQASARPKRRSRTLVVLGWVIRRLPALLINLLLLAVVIGLALLTWSPAWFGASGR